MLTWSELAARTLARQFPSDLEPGDVVGLLDRVGPIQSQTARAVFIGAGARLPGTTREQLTDAYESFAIVRGSTLRGTVHTSTAELHPLLDVTTRIGQRSLWNRSIKLVDESLENLWAGTEAFAADDWRSAAELLEGMLAWLARHDPRAIADFRGMGAAYFGFGHGGLIRRPGNGDWAGQSAPGYRTAADLLGDRSATLAAADAAVDALLRHQISAAGPLSRNELSWWSGLGLARVDAALARLDLPTEVGPDGRLYVDVPDAPPPVLAFGVRLLPEYDALICAFDGPGRQRFLNAEDYHALWTHGNGQIPAPVLVDDRLCGHWRFTGNGRRRSLDVTRYPGARPLAEDELTGPVTGLELALGIEITDVRLH